jgi:hypothetical protein
VLGPKLFSLYTRGLSDIIEEAGAKIVIYADDSYVICTERDKASLKSKIQEVLIMHQEWLRRHGMVVNTSKTEMVFFNQHDNIEVEIDGVSIKSADEMNVLGVTFDRRMSWEAQLNRVVLNCQRIKPGLRYLKQRLSKKDFLQVVTSNYFSRLYYASEIWYNVLSSSNKSRLSAIHHYPLRLVTDSLCYKKRVSNKKLAMLTLRASPIDLNNYKIAKLLISVINNVEPFVLFNEFLSHSVLERRKPNNPSFLDTSRLRIGRQSIANRVNSVAQQIKFPWLEVPLSVDTLRRKLKMSFFSHLSSPPRDY